MYLYYLNGHIGTFSYGYIISLLPFVLQLTSYREKVKIIGG